MSCTFCCRNIASSKRLGITFHSFPKDDIMKNRWIEACVSRGCELTGKNINYVKLCSIHFTSNDFEVGSRVRRSLKKNVVPSRFWRKSYEYCIACNDVGSANSNVNLHEFPEDPGLRKKWIDACVQNGYNIRNIFTQHKLCSNHFPLNGFNANNKRRKHLELDAVPINFSSLTRSASCTVEQCGNSITDTKFVDSTWGDTVNAAFRSVESRDDISSSSSKIKCVHTSNLITEDVDPFNFPLLTNSASCTVKQCKNSITDTKFIDSTSSDIVNAAFRSVEPRNDIISPSTKIKCVDISNLITDDAKRQMILLILLSMFVFQKIRHS